MRDQACLVMVTSLAGMPSNVRNSVLAGLEQEHRHSIDEALRPVITLQVRKQGQRHLTLTETLV